MLINTQVVRALMTLRRIDEENLANIANVATSLLSQWLSDGTDGDDLIAFDTQLEILQVLGINGETPRRDMVHHWYVHQDLFSSNAKAFWAVKVMTEAFGGAEVVYFAKEADPLVSTTSCTHFGLQFSSFKALLQVTSHPLRNIGFDPADFENLRWQEGATAVLVDREQFAMLGARRMTPRMFDSQLSIGREQLAWERLTTLSRENKIGPDQLEHLLRNVQNGLLAPQLSGQVNPATAAGAQQAVAESIDIVVPEPAKPAKAVRQDRPVDVSATPEGKVVEEVKAQPQVPPAAPVAEPTPTAPAAPAPAPVAEPPVLRVVSAAPAPAPVRTAAPAAALASGVLRAPASAAPVQGNFPLPRTASAEGKAESAEQKTTTPTGFVPRPRARNNRPVRSATNVGIR